QDTVAAPIVDIIDTTIGGHAAQSGWDAAYSGATPADLSAPACGVPASTESAGPGVSRPGADVAVGPRARQGASGTLSDLNDNAFAYGVSLNFADPTADFSVVVTSVTDRSAEHVITVDFDPTGFSTAATALTSLASSTAGSVVAFIFNDMV